MAEPLPKHRSREYETIFILNPDVSMDAIDGLAGRVTDVITRLDGKLLKAENWGKRRLAYLVKKQSRGYYLYLKYLGYSDMVQEIERNLRMMEPVIKYLTVKIEEDVDPAARPVNEADISFVPLIEEEPQSEQRASGDAGNLEENAAAEANADDIDSDDDETAPSRDGGATDNDDEGDESVDSSDDSDSETDSDSTEESSEDSDEEEE